MKLTKTQLQRIIQEELDKLVEYGTLPSEMRGTGDMRYRAGHGGERAPRFGPFKIADDPIPEEWIENCHRKAGVERDWDRDPDYGSAIEAADCVHGPMPARMTKWGNEPLAMRLGRGDVGAEGERRGKNVGTGKPHRDRTFKKTRLVPKKSD